MRIRRVWAVYFSPTGNTKALTCAAAQEVAAHLQAAYQEIDLTRPAAREAVYNFAADDFVLVGSPTYAGKLPNKILPYFQAGLRGLDTPAMALVSFGNRSYDNALAELCATLEQGGFRVLAGGAFVGRHAFSDQLASGRPDAADLQQLRNFAAKTTEKWTKTHGNCAKIQPKGDANALYYVPKGEDGQPAKFLKAKPRTRAEVCTACGLCAAACPMGSIDRDNPAQVSGICIKCQSCVRNCPHGAKYFDDPAFLSHVRMLEQHFTRRAENEMFW